MTENVTGLSATATVEIDLILAPEMRAAHREAVNQIGSMAYGDHSKH